MKTLYLLRHAKSSWGDASLRDIDRPLNKRGKHDAPLMGKQLKETGIKLDLMVVSPAKRAYSTAKRIAKELGYSKESIKRDPAIYEASAADIIALVRTLDSTLNEVMIIGHNPTFTSLANMLGDTELDNMPTCSVVCIRFEIEEWKAIENGSGRVEFFKYPKQFYSNE